MSETAKVTFYRIKDCGFYKRGQDTPEFGSTFELLVDLQRWSNGKRLVQTKVFEPLDGQDVHPVYLLDIKNSDDTWLVATWNQTPSNEAGVASIQGESSVGDAEVKMTEIEPGGIPGFATYFWFLPKQGLFASVRFQHLWTGQKSLQIYLESFLGQFSRFVVFGQPDADTEINIIGFRKDTKSPIESLLPKYRTVMAQKPGRRDLILQKAESIRKVIRKTTLKLTRTPDRDFWQRMLQMTGISPPGPETRPEKIRVQYEIATPVSSEEVKVIIADWDAHHDREWDDYGFEFKGESGKPLWLSHSLAREEFELDVKRDNPEVINSDSLLKALNSARENIMEILKT